MGLPATSADKIREDLRKAAREDFGAFCVYVLDFDVAPFHREWMDALLENDWVAIIAPRGHGKSSLVSFAYPLWRIGRNPNIRIKLVTQNDDKAKDLLFQISTALQSPRYQEVFPEIRPAKGRYWTKSKIFVERDRILRDATVEAAGINTSVLGGRADLLVGDDVCDARNIATVGLRKTVKEAWYNVWLNLLEAGGSQVVYVGTKWHNDDVCSEIQKNPSYKVLFYAIDEDFTPLWPRKWSRERLMDAYRTRGSYAFNRGFRNLPATDADFDFPPSIIEPCIDPSWDLGGDLDSLLGVEPQNAITTIKTGDTTNLRKYTGVDLAISKASGAAFTVIFTIGVTQDDVRIPIEIKRARMNSPETARAILDTYQRHQPEIVMVESNTYQRAVIEWMQELVKLPLRGFYTGSSKKEDTRIGIKSIAVEFENRMWRLPRIGHTTDCTCGFCSWINELHSYPHGVHDDTVMAMWLAREAYRELAGTNTGGFSVWSFQ